MQQAKPLRVDRGRKTGDTGCVPARPCALTGSSVTLKTMGIAVLVPPVVTITATERFVSSFASTGNRSVRFGSKADNRAAQQLQVLQP